MKNSELRRLIESMIDVINISVAVIKNHEHNDDSLVNVEADLIYMSEIAQEALDERLDTAVTTSKGLADLLDREGYTFTGDSQTDLVTARGFMPRGMK